MFLACAESEALILVEYQSEHHDSNPEGKNCTRFGIPPISKLLILRKPKTWYFVEGLTEVSVGIANTSVNPSTKYHVFGLRRIRSFDIGGIPKRTS
jgi:hypothetical protein